MPKMSEATSLKAVMEDAGAAAALRELLGIQPDQAFPFDALELPIAPVLKYFGYESADFSERLARMLSEFEAPSFHEADAILPNPDYEDASVPRGSATLLPVAPGALHRMSELTLLGPTAGNPFVDVELSATFVSGQHSVRVGGFYDGDGEYRVRFLPPAVGTWRFSTESTARSLDGIDGELVVGASDEAGPLQVTNSFHLEHRDGMPFIPFGTTLYVWNLQAGDVVARTLETLKSAPFNKVRMCVFPKWYQFNNDEPAMYPFLQDSDGSDFTRFNPAYFQLLETRIQQLADLGIEADLILFHPYDKWGFNAMGKAADDRFARYVVRRLAAFSNVWWSMANEYDFCTNKTVADWHRLGELVAAEDHAGHLLSIHNGLTFFDHSAPWITHVSVQSGEVQRVAEFRRSWNKPVLMDECGYEGDLEWDWGCITPQTMVRRFWETHLRGGYCTHGETYRNAQNELWWSKGGNLRGESVARLRFLREILQAVPGGQLEPIPGGPLPAAGRKGEYELRYFGALQPGSYSANVPEGRVARVEVIDTWSMTIAPAQAFTAGDFTVPLPTKPDMAVRIRFEDASSK